MSKINTDLSSTPYWDDYNEDKQYYKTLFVPKRAVQVREVNQIQTAQQEQVRRHADHVFKDGSVVSGCNITYDIDVNFVRVRTWNNDNANTAFSTEDLNDFLVVSPTGLRAAVTMANPGFVATYPDTNTLYIKYLNKGRDQANNEVSVFGSAEQLTVYSPLQDKFGALDSGLVYNTINTITPGVDQQVVGKAYSVTVGDGVVYQKGYFVKVLPNTVLVRKYDRDVDGMLVGFETLEQIVTYLQDSTLIDPADTSNRNGIGADRLKLTPILVAKHRNDITSNDDFFPIIEFGEEEVPVKQNSDPEYAKLGDMMAREQFETHGDFFIKPFVVSSKSVANTQNFAYTIDSGIAYVKGNRVQLINTINVETPRSTQLGFYNGNITTLNYGNYILVNQVIGTFNADKLITVDIYDAAQTAVTSTRSPNSPTGNKVGTANVRAVVYNSGGKGGPTAQYKLYITNIIMDSGKSFVNDAKSFAISNSDNGLAYGALADIILTNSIAQIKDSSLNGLIFDSGIIGTRRLRDPNGVNDTAFTFRDTSTATLQANGSVTFTLNTPHAGGAERFFVSPGILSNVNKLKIDITTTTAAEGSNLAGTVNGNTGNTSVVGSGTSFTTDFNPGELIRIDSVNYTVESIANNTLMAVNAAISGGSPTSNYSKAYSAGSVIDLSTATVTAVSNTQFTVSLGFSVASGAPQTLIATYPVIRSAAYEIKKDVHKDTFVKIDCSSAGASGPFNLGIVDVYEISAVHVGPNYSENNPDRSGWFTLDGGQQPTHYDHAKLNLRPEYQGKLDTNSRILVKLNHFTANTTTGVGFFSVDSYPTRAPGDVANTTNISYDEIPDVFGYNLRNAVDFRPQKINTANLALTEAAATINPGVANTEFSISGAGSYIGEPSTNFQADIEYYLPRIDIIQVNKDGVFAIKSSNPTENPIAPVADQDAMQIASAYVPPYPGVAADQITRYPTNKPKIRTSLTGNRGYTMKDINTLDRRITTLEYYQMLSMLEQQAKDYVVLDENGLDRFKNGIFVNPFNNHLLSDVSNFEYGIAIDEDMEIARPKINKTDIDLDIANTSNIRVNGRVATLDYTDKLFIKQPYASKFRNVVDGIWQWNGHLSLFPEYDHHKNEKSLPAVNVSVDLASPWEDFASSPFAQSYGDWRVIDETTSSSVKESSGFNNNNPFAGLAALLGLGGGSAASTTTTTTTSTTSARSVTKLKVKTKQNTQDLGSYVTDVTLNPYMRSRQIAFVATGLRPNTRFWPYFANTLVSDHCAPGVINSLYYNEATGLISVTSGKEDQVVTKNGNLGAPLITDSEGNVSGIFVIPNDTFRVGDRQFVLVDVDDMEIGADASISSAAATFTASSLTTTSRDLSITTVNPKISSSTKTQKIVERSTNIVEKPSTPARTGTDGVYVMAEGHVGFVAYNSAQYGQWGGSPIIMGYGCQVDPLGQTILIDTPNNVPGVFLNDIEVFFRSKDTTLGITCVITEVLAGVPNRDRILATSYLKPSEISTSLDSSAGTKFKFADLPYLSKDKYYAFFLQPDGDSPEYTIWMSEVGDVDILTGDKIFTNPYIGVAVKSANSESWDVLMTEDIKFNASICRFNNENPGKITFVEEDDDFFTVDGFAFANTTTTIQVGDVVYSADANNDVITGGGAPFGFVQDYDQISDTLVIDRSTGGFTANTIIHIYRPPEPNNPASISPSNLIASTTIISVDDVEYSIIVPRISTTTPTGTAVSYQFKGTDNSSNVDSNYYNLEAETEIEMIDKMRVIRSKSNRVGDATTAEMVVNLEASTFYVSPIVNLRRRSLFAISNIINNDLTNEHTRYGNSLVRYISPSITLAEGQDAEDIRVLISGYRPSGTDIAVYAKILCADDPDNFLDKNWTRLDMIEGSSIFSSSADTGDYREYVYSFPSEEEMQGTAYINADNQGIVEYRNSAGTIFVGYKSYALKAVLVADNKQLVPRIDDIRCMNLQI